MAKTNLAAALAAMGIGSGSVRTTAQGRSNSGRGGYTPPGWAGTRNAYRLRGRARGVRRSSRGYQSLRHTDSPLSAMMGETNGRKPRTRVLWQVHEGQVTGGHWRKDAGGDRTWVPYVTDEARHTAHGILPGRPW